MTVPSMKDEVKELILRALTANYISESSFNKIQTGNHYQSVRLDGEALAGFRSNRDEFLDQIPFEGKKVLDLGSNLGEMSRAARARGAWQVDGFEYDRYFLEIANLVNAHNDVTRVSFYQRDITDPAIYTERYDIVLGLSVFTYLVGVVEQLAAITDELFILETHRLTDNLESTYLLPILRHFPYYATLGESDWGLPHDASEKRAIIVFAKRAATLRAALKDTTVILDASGSTVPPDDMAIEPGAPVERRLDLSRTAWYDRFFSTFDFATTDDLLAAIRAMDVDVDTLARSHDSRVLEYGGWVYWLLYVRGYLQYNASGGELGDGNAYYDYIMKHYLPRSRDPGLAVEMANPEMTVERLRRRFRDFDMLQARREQAFEGDEAVPLPKIILGNPPPEDALAIYAVGSEAAQTARFVDGHHRIFVAKLLRLDGIPCTITAEDPDPPPLRGVIERFSYDGHRLVVSGWGVRAGRDIDLFEVRVDGKAVANTTVTYRKDVQKAFPPIPFAGNSGFAFDCAYESDGRSQVRFDIIALNALLPVGAMMVTYLDGMFAERNWPPPALTERLLHESDPARLATRAVTCLQQMLAPIARHRALDSFERVLDWGVGCGTLELFLPQFLPRAAVTGIDIDEEAIAWCQQSGLAGTFAGVGAMPPTDLPSGAFDLVLGYQVMTHLGREQQAAWLDELHRLVKPGGFVALKVFGELVRSFVASERVRGELDASGIADVTPARRDTDEAATPPTPVVYQTKEYALAAYQNGFEIVEYSEGGVANQHDLIILRRR